MCACFLHQKKPDTPDLNHFTGDEWELPKEEFTLVEELGTGYFADVYQGCWKGHIKVAIKIIKSGNSSCLLNLRGLTRERYNNSCGQNHWAITLTTFSGSFPKSKIVSAFSLLFHCKLNIMGFSTQNKRLLLGALENCDGKVSVLTFPCQSNEKELKDESFKKIISCSHNCRPLILYIFEPSIWDISIVFLHFAGYQQEFHECC